MATDGKRRTHNSLSWMLPSCQRVSPPLPEGSGGNSPDKATGFMGKPMVGHISKVMTTIVLRDTNCTVNDNGSYFLDKKIHNNDDLMFPTVRSL